MILELFLPGEELSRFWFDSVWIDLSNLGGPWVRLAKESFPLTEESQLNLTLGFFSCGDEPSDSFSSVFGVETLVIKG